MAVIWSYHKTSSRGAYGHDPFLSVFEEYPLDSTRSDSTMTIIYNINSAVVISVVEESSQCSSKTLKTGSCSYAPLDEALRYVVFICRLPCAPRNSHVESITATRKPHPTPCHINCPTWLFWDSFT